MSFFNYNNQFEQEVNYVNYNANPGDRISFDGHENVEVVCTYPNSITFLDPYMLRQYESVSDNHKRVFTEAEYAQVGVSYQKLRVAGAFFTALRLKPNIPKVW